MSPKTPKILSKFETVKSTSYLSLIILSNSSQMGLAKSHSQKIWIIDSGNLSQKSQLGEYFSKCRKKWNLKYEIMASPLNFVNCGCDSWSFKLILEVVWRDFWAILFWKQQALYTQPCTLSAITSHLTAHNWQKWKRVFLTCPCHEIYRVQAVGLKSSNYAWKNMIFANMWNLGQFREKFIFCQ